MSTDKVVYLNNVDLNTAGRFRCEVSSTYPSFNTAAAEKDIKVYGELK